MKLGREGNHFENVMSSKVKQKENPYFETG